MTRRGLVLAISLCGVLMLPLPTSIAAQDACDPNNGIGPDGGLPALPPPAEPDATFVDLAQAASPVDMVLDDTSGRLYVVERGANDVVAIDARAEAPTIVGSAKVGDRPPALALDEASQRLFVANGSSCSVSVLDVSAAAPQLAGTVRSASGPRGVAVDPATGHAWTANWSGDKITLIDGRADPPATVGDSLVVGQGHVATAVDPSAARVIMISDSGLQVFDPTTGQPVGAVVLPPGSVDVTTDGSGNAFVVHSTTGQVTRVDMTGETPLVTATTGNVAREPFDVRYVPSIDRVIVPSRNGEVLLLDPSTLELAGRVPSSPTVAAALVDEATGRLWMLDYTYHRVWSVPLEGIVVP